MNVTEAVSTRRSVRQFVNKPVDKALLERILVKAQQSPSGGNTQPWNAVVLTGQPLADLTAKIKAKAATAPMGEGHEYDIYPKALRAVMKTNVAASARQCSMRSALPAKTAQAASRR